jgi:hypothetical protein
MSLCLPASLALNIARSGCGCGKPKPAAAAAVQRQMSGRALDAPLLDHLLDAEEVCVCVCA